MASPRVELLDNDPLRGDALRRELARRLSAAGAAAAAGIALVTDMDQITTYGVMAVPAVVGDGRVLAVGRLPTVEELRDRFAGDDRRAAPADGEPGR